MVASVLTMYAHAHISLIFVVENPKMKSAKEENDYMVLLSIFFNPMYRGDYGAHLRELYGLPLLSKQYFLIAMDYFRSK